VLITSVIDLSLTQLLCQLFTWTTLIDYNRCVNIRPSKGICLFFWVIRMLAVASVGVAIFACINRPGFAEGGADALSHKGTNPPINHVVETIKVGIQPWMVIVSPDNEYVYVADPGTETVSVIRASSETVTLTIPVGSSPESIAITPDGKTLYVANSGDDTVSVINARDGISITTIDKVGYQPSSLAVSPDGKRVYVANFGDGTVAIINTETNRISGSPIHVTGEPEDLVFAPNQAEIYLASAGGNSGALLLRKIPGSRKFVHIGGNKIAPNALTMGPDGKMLYSIGNQGHFGLDTVLSIDLTRVRVVCSVAPPAGIDSLNALAITPNGKFLYAAGVANTQPPSSGLFMIDAATGEIVGQTIQVGYGTMSIAIAPNGRMAYTANLDDGSVTAIAIEQQ